MMGTLEAVGCLVVRTPRAISFLGHMPVMRWAAEQLIDVRGLTKIICVVVPTLAAKAAEALKGTNIAIVAMPPKLSPRAGALEEWLVSPDGPVPGASTLLLVKATVPFLPVAKAEKCLDSVRRGKCAVSTTVRTVRTINPEGATGAKHVEIVAGVRAVRPGAAGPITPITVALTEALDVEHDDEFCLAGALVETGKIEA